MSDTPLDEETVAAYLRQHPEFFQHHEELLTEITVPHESGEAISLIERQVAVLRERNIELRNRLHKLLDVARENDQLFEKARALILALLETSSLPQLTSSLSNGLRERFNSEYVSLLLFDVSDEALGAAQAVSFNDAQERVPSLIKNRRALAGQLRKDEREFLFGDGAEHVASCAVIPVVQERTLGLLAIGSSDPEHFKSSMDTLFITHIGDVLARLLSLYVGSSANRRTA